jgi:beta-barrel assembly-enhancing protease
MRGIIRFVIAIVVALFSLVTYFFSTQENPVTGEKQRVNISVEQEIALGLQAAPQMAQQHGGLHPNTEMQQRVKTIGQQLVRESKAAQSPYKFDFHVLADERTVNAFALPGGQIFITAGLLNQFTSDDQLAGVLGHEIGHVVARHSAERIAKQRLTQGLTGAAVIASYDPNNPSTMRTAAVAALIGNLVNMKYGRSDELESDKLGVRIMHQSGYNPAAMEDVMNILAQAGGPNRQPEFFSTHPNPENRISNIRREIEQLPDQPGPTAQSGGY